jgi:hypothetical protein
MQIYVFYTLKSNRYMKLYIYKYRSIYIFIFNCTDTLIVELNIKLILLVNGGGYVYGLKFFTIKPFI